MGANRHLARLPLPVVRGMAGMLLGISLTLPACAEDSEQPVEEPTIAKVHAVYSILASERKSVKECYPQLISERDMLQREHDQQPFALKYGKPLSALGLGWASSDFYDEHMKGVISPNAEKWRIPFIAANAVEGYMIGPGASFGAWAGAEIGVSLSSGNLWAALAGDILGSIVGAIVWNFLFPQHPAMGPLPTDPEGDIPVEYFFRDKVCAETSKRSFDAPEYRVEFVLNGIEFFADLPYDPGEGLRIAPDGTILGPFRERAEE